MFILWQIWELKSSFLNVYVVWKPTYLCCLAVKKLVSSCCWAFWKSTFKNSCFCVAKRDKARVCVTWPLESPCPNKAHVFVLTGWEKTHVLVLLGFQKAHVLRKLTFFVLPTRWKVHACIVRLLESSYNDINCTDDWEFNVNLLTYTLASTV